MINHRALCVSRWMAVSLSGLAALSIGSPQASTTPQRVVIDKYCISCHNDRVKTAGLALNNINPETPGEHPEVWEKVVRKMRARYMPPPGLPRPDENAYNQAVSSLE